MFATATWRWVGAVLAAGIFFAASVVLAQTNSSDAAAKAKIMQSDAWKQMAAEYQKWLNNQVIYTQDDLNRINANLAAQLQALPASDMQEFLSDWQAKVKVLNGKDFQQAQEWLGEYMSALSDGYRKKTLTKVGLTDVANMTADQLENAIEQIRADRLAVQRNQSEFNKTRDQQVQTVQQANAASQQAQLQDASQSRSAAQFNSFQSPYKPTGLFNPLPRFQAPMYVDPEGRVGYALPF